jgi:predicted MFS family arabinose efflux permease
MLLAAAPDTAYAVGMLPATILVALGMGSVVAPLTSAVLASVDDAHTGTASGFNSAVARTGMLIAVALAGAVIAQSGAQLTAAFHAAAVIAAVLCAVSGGIAFATLSIRPAQ